MSYRQDGYDINRWIADGMRPRRRGVTLRWMLAGGLTLSLAMPVVALLTPGEEGHAASVLPHLPLLIALGRSPFARDSWARNHDRASFDKFERDVLGRATRHAYTLFLAIAALGAGWMWAASAWDMPFPAGVRAWSTIALSLIFAGLALPVVLAEWMMPLPPAPETVED